MDETIRNQGIDFIRFSLSREREINHAEEAWLDDDLACKEPSRKKAKYGGWLSETQTKGR